MLTQRSPCAVGDAGESVGVSGMCSQQQSMHLTFPVSLDGTGGLGGMACVLWLLQGHCKREVSLGGDSVWASIEYDLFWLCESHLTMQVYQTLFIFTHDYLGGCGGVSDLHNLEWRLWIKH